MTIFHPSIPFATPGEVVVSLSNTSSTVNLSQAITLSRQCSPLMMEKDDRGHPVFFASSLMHCPFALLSTGGAVTDTSTVVPSAAILMASRLARGLILTANVQRDDMKFTLLPSTAHRAAEEPLPWSVHHRQVPSPERFPLHPAVRATPR